MLSYVPFSKSTGKLGLRDFGGSPTHISSRSPKLEGQYDRTDSNYESRANDQEEISKFLDSVFGSKKTMSYAEYAAFNQEISSEMFYSIMKVLQDTLPCTRNFFRLKRNYRVKN